jgi:hypothetical protein
MIAWNELMTGDHGPLFMDMVRSIHGTTLSIHRNRVHIGDCQRLEVQDRGPTFLELTRLLNETNPLRHPEVITKACFDIDALFNTNLPTTKESSQ